MTLKAVHDMLISVVIAAFNEELYLPETLSSLRDAIPLCRCSVELIVVDNDSVDRTRDVARSFGATVVQEAVHNISRVRNAGASVARGDVLAFVDADTIVPPYFLDRIAEAMGEAAGMARTAARPIDDMRGMVDQRNHLAGVLVRRALEGAVQRARG